MSLLTTSDKALWRLALPMIFSNITVPLLGLVDTAVIGHLDSPVYLGGVAIGATATQLPFYAAALFAYEYHRAYGSGVRRKRSVASGACAGTTLDPCPGRGVR